MPARSSLSGIIRHLLERSLYNFGISEVLDHLEIRTEILLREWLYQYPFHHTFRQKNPVEH